MIDLVFSRFRFFRFRLRYYYYKAKIKYKNNDFIWDNSSHFETLLTTIKKQNYEKIVIIGNAPNITALSKEKFNAYKQNPKVLTIGLNKSYLLFNTDILLWGDHPVLSELLSQEKELSSMLFLFASQLLDERRTSLVYWKRHRSFTGYPYKTLFKARTILVSALYLSYLLNIKEIDLYGISLDDGSYFYKENRESKERKNFEFLSTKVLEKKYYGYSMQKITKEILEYLIEEDFDIHFGGESHFLTAINGLSQTTST